MTDVVVHAEVKRLQKEVETLKQNLIEARQEIANVQTAAAGSVIKSVQRGTISLGSGNGSGTATISPVDMNKAELRHLGAKSSATELMSTMFFSISLSGPSTVTASRWTGTGTVAASVSFEITEYY